MYTRSNAGPNVTELWKYGITVAAVATALGVALLVRDFFSECLWVVFLLAILGSSWLGKGTGLVAAVLSIATVVSFSIVPRRGPSSSRDEFVFLLNLSTAALALGWAASSLAEMGGYRAQRQAVALQRANAALGLEAAECRRQRDQAIQRVRSEPELPVSQDAEVLRKTNEVLVAQLAEGKRAEQQLRQVQETFNRTQAHVASVSRSMTADELTASIAHEVNQPLAAVVTSAMAGVRWLGGDPPNVERARTTLERIVADGHRASEIVRRIRALYKRNPPDKQEIDPNQTILDTIDLLRIEGIIDGASVQMELCDDLPHITADLVQLQQVLLNLIKNAMEAMKQIKDRPRELRIRSARDGDGKILVSFTDSGVGLNRENADKIFNAFFTTKPDGLGMGLAVCRSIIEAHQGRLWAVPNGHGATFQFTLPIKDDET
jgi:signal transduction histidine kinase